VVLGQLQHQRRQVVDGQQRLGELGLREQVRLTLTVRKQFGG
jgi:hypothetical protein